MDTAIALVALILPAVLYLLKPNRELEEKKQIQIAAEELGFEEVAERMKVDRIIILEKYRDREKLTRLFAGYRNVGVCTAISYIILIGTGILVKGIDDDYFSGFWLWVTVSLGIGLIFSAILIFTYGFKLLRKDEIRRRELESQKD